MARKTKEVTADEMETRDEDQAEVRVYELGFHIDPELPSEEVKKVYEGVRAIVAGAGTVVAENAPMKVQLAYTISKSDTAGRRDFDTAFFAWIAYEANGEGHEAVLAAAREEGRIFRHIDLRTTKEQALHMAEMAQLAATAAAEAPQEADEVSDAELSAAIEEAAV